MPLHPPPPPCLPQKHIDDVPELKAEKQAMNRRTLKAMQAGGGWWGRGTHVPAAAAAALADRRAMRRLAAKPPTHPALPPPTPTPTHRLHCRRASTKAASCCGSRPRADATAASTPRPVRRLPCAWQWGLASGTVQAWH